MKSYAETGGQDGAIFDYVSAHNYAKKELGQYPAILTEQLMNLSILYNICFVNRNYFIE